LAHDVNGAALRAWRTRHGLTQTKAGIALGLSLRAIQNYEHGARLVPRSIALACAALELGLEAYDGEPLALRAGPLMLKGGK
jgi:transcriptional regulator with XRE-family HTH domain